MKLKSHHTQRNRRNVMAMIPRLLAPTMPKGAKDKAFRAVVCLETGATAEKVAEYFTILQDSGRIEWDIDKEVWRLPI